MEQLYLKDVCSFANGKAHEQYVDENGDYVLVTSKFIASDGEFYRRTNDRLTPLEIGDLCMVMSDVPKGRALAKCFLVDKNNTYTLNQRIGVFKADERYLKKYFYYLINRNKYFLSFDDGDSQTNLRKDDILNCPVICPDKAEQQLVVDILDGISEIIQNRKAQLKKLDELVKARFVELFGNPVINEKGWNTSPLNDVCDGIGDGLHGTPEYDIDGDYPFINGNNLMDGSIEITPATKMVDERAYKKHYIEITDNAILLSINGTLGKLAFYRGEEVMLGKSACYCNLKPEINREFVYGVMKTDAFSGFLESNSTASTIKNVGLKAIRGFNLILPPDDLQNEYVEFAKQVDKSKVAVQKALNETQNLFDSLMQEYFG